MKHPSCTGWSTARRRGGAIAVLLVLLAGSTGAAALLLSRWLTTLTTTAPAAATGGETLLDLLTRPRELDEVLGELAAGAALLVLLVTALSTLASVALEARGRSRQGRPRPAAWEAAVAPTLLRRLAATALGVGVITGAAATGASAAAPQTSAISVPLVPAWPATGGGTAPADTAGAGASPSPAAPTGPPPPARGAHDDLPADRVVVAPGDTLWGIAAAHLPEGAAPGAVAEQWPRWWSANRTVIGDDPDLVLPGQQLQAPAESTR